MHTDTIGTVSTNTVSDHRVRNVPDDLWHRLSMLAARRKRKLWELVVEAIRRYVDTEEEGI